MTRRLSVVTGAAILALALAVMAASAGTAASGHRPLSPVAQAAQYLKTHGYIPIGGPAAYERYSAAAAARAARLHPSSSPQPVSPDDPIAGPSWQGLDENDLSPPDPTGAIGPNSYVQTINLQIGIYDRTGGLIAKRDFYAFTGTDSEFLSDPQIYYSVRWNRFYYLILNVDDLLSPKSTMLWGFSKSNNPSTADSGSWCNYETDFGWGGTIADYPKLGVTMHDLLVGVNIYPTLATFTGSDVGWIKNPINTRRSITTCPPAGSIVSGKVGPLMNADGATLSSTPEPAKQIDPSETGWIVAVPDSTNSGASGTTLELYKVTEKPDGTPNIPTTATAEVTVDAYSPPAPAPQKDGVHPLDTLDGRLTNAISAVDPARGNATALWTQHTVFGGAGAEVRWYEIDAQNATLFQSGSATDPELFCFNGGVSPDRAVKGKKPGNRFFGQNLVLGFSTSSANDYPAVQMLSKKGNQPQSGFVMVKASPGPDEGFDCWELGRCRWGDYAGAAPDPAAPATATTGKVWLTNMWANGVSDPFAATWRTWNWGAIP